MIMKGRNGDTSSKNKSFRGQTLNLDWTLPLQFFSPSPIPEAHFFMSYSLPLARVTKDPMKFPLLTEAGNVYTLTQPE